jgi:hypothetical protein
MRSRAPFDDWISASRTTKPNRYDLHYHHTGDHADQELGLFKSLPNE